VITAWLNRWREARAYQCLCDFRAIYLPPTDRPWTKDDLGRLGEDMSAIYLQAQGCKLLYKNYKCPEGGEADIVVRHRDSLVFVEVKTRSFADPVHRPRDAVNREKRDLIRRASRSWRSLLEQRVNYRYDIMEVLLIPGKLPELSWVQQAFEEQG
jgi:putative endonuclease